MHFKKIITGIVRIFSAALIAVSLTVTAAAETCDSDDILIPVLMYHAVDETEGVYPQLFVKTSEFYRQMRYLYQNGYTPVGFNAPETYKGIKKPVIITFDDGYENNYTNAYPVLKKFGFTATIFLVASTVATPGHLSLAQIKEMSGSIVFGSHTVNHRKLIELDAGQLKCELVISKITLEKLTGQIINVLAYPYGSYNGNVLDIARCWYNYAVTVEKGLYNTGGDNMRINRIYITRSDTVDQFAAKLTGSAY